MVYQRPEDAPQRRPEDVLNMSLFGSISKGEKRPRDKYFVPRDKDLVLPLVIASINVILLKWLPQHSGLRIRKEGIWKRVLNWISRRIYFYHQKFYQFLFIFHQFNKFFLLKVFNFTVKLIIH